MANEKCRRNGLSRLDFLFQSGFRPGFNTKIAVLKLLGEGICWFRVWYHRYPILFGMHFHRSSGERLQTVTHTLATSQFDYCNMCYMGLPLKTTQTFNQFKMQSHHYPIAVWLLQHVQQGTALEVVYPDTSTSSRRDYTHKHLCFASCTGCRFASKHNFYLSIKIDLLYKFAGCFLQKSYMAQHRA